MPAISDITVKKYDNVTDAVYTGVQGSSGDGKSPSIYRLQSSVAVAFRPELRVWARDNGNRTARRLDATYFYPQIVTNTTTGLVSIANKSAFSLSAVMPLEMLQADLSEAAAQFFHLLNHSRMVDVFRLGYAEN